MTILISSVGRSGSTWLFDLIDHRRQFKRIFEPFHHDVDETSEFHETRYIIPSRETTEQIVQMGKVIDGKIDNPWSNRWPEQTGEPLIKSIRSNLLLRFIEQKFSNTKLVFLLRHPLSVSESWHRQGGDLSKTQNEFELIFTEDNLLRAYPAINHALENIDINSTIERVVLMWSVIAMIARTEANPYIVFYEDLLLYPEITCNDLFKYLNIEPDWEKFIPLVTTPSMTTSGIDDRNLLNPWKEYYFVSQVERANQIMSWFGCHDIYDKDGLPNKGGQ